MIFNVAVDSIISHWVALVTPPEAGTRGLGMTIIDLPAYLYADYGLVALIQLERLQRAFDVLTGLFNRVVLRKNTSKTIGMVFQPCHTPGGMSEEAYERRTTGEGPTFWGCQRRRVECPECRVEVSAGSLLMHHQIQPSLGRGGRWGSPPLPPPREAQNYRLYFPKHLSRI